MQFWKSVPSLGIVFIIAYLGLGLVIDSQAFHPNIQIQVGENIIGSRTEINPSQSRIAVASENSVWIKDFLTQEVGHTISVSENRVADIEWTGSGEFLAIAAGNEVQIWSLSDARVTQVFQTPTQSLFGITSVDWRASTSEFVAIAPPSAYVWNMDTQEVTHSYSANPTPILAGAWSPDGARLALENTTGWLVVYDFTTEQSASIDTYEYAAILSIEWSENNEALLIGTGSNHAEIFTLDQFLFRSQLLLSEDENIVDVHWNPIDNRLLAFASDQSMIVVFDLQNQEPVNTFQLDFPIASFAWDVNGTQLIYSDLEGNALFEAIDLPSPPL